MVAPTRHDVVAGPGGRLELSVEGLREGDRARVLIFREARQTEKPVDLNAVRELLASSTAEEKRAMAEEARAHSPLGQPALLKRRRDLGDLAEFIGCFHSGDAESSNNERIDADIAREIDGDSSDRSRDAA